MHMPIFHKIADINKLVWKSNIKSEHAICKIIIWSLGEDDVIFWMIFNDMIFVDSKTCCVVDTPLQINCLNVNNNVCKVKLYCY